MASITLLRISVALTIQLEDKGNLSIGLHPFLIGRHTVALGKALHACGDHYNLVAGDTGTMVTDVVQMSVHDSVAVPTTLGMAQGSLSCTCLVLSTFCGQQHSSVADL